MYVSYTGPIWTRTSPVESHLNNCAVKKAVMDYLSILSGKFGPPDSLPAAAHEYRRYDALCDLSGK